MKIFGRFISILMVLTLSMNTLQLSTTISNAETVEESKTITKMEKETVNEELYKFINENYDNSLRENNYHINGSESDIFDYEKILADDDMTEKNTEVPEIEKALIMTESDTAVTVNSFGAISNQGVKIMVTARSTKNSPVTLYLKNGDEVIEKTANVPYEEENGYVFFDTFIIPYPENGGSVSYTVYASNEIGTGDEIPLPLSYIDEEGEVKTTNNIIFERELPSVSAQVITYDNIDTYFEVSANIVDQISGIKKIEYKWDQDNNWTTYSENSNDKYIEGTGTDESFDYSRLPDKVIPIKIRVPYSNADKVQRNNHIVYFRITDNAGNVVEEDSNSKSYETIKGQDESAPVITSVEIAPYDDEKLFADISKQTKFGIAVQEKFKITVKAKDTTDGTYVSGISQVMLLNDEQETKYAALETTIDGDEHTYTFVIEPNTVFNPLKIKVQDNGGKAITKNISEVSTITTDNIFYEETPPSIRPDYSEAVNNGEKCEDNHYWYNLDGGKFKINVEDVATGVSASGISTIKIEETNLEDTDRLNKTLTFEDYKLTETIEIDTSTLSNGKHTYEVQVFDYCGNSSKKEFEIYIDHSVPEMNFQVQKPKPVRYDNQDWYDKDDTIVIRANIVSQVSMVKNFLINVNGQTYDKSDLVMKSDLESGEKYVEINIDTNGWIDEHVISVTGDVETVSGNKSNTEKYKCYIDTDEPQISKVTVDNVNKNIIEKIVNVIKTGSFSNDSLILKAYVSDAEFDSGISRVVATYTDCNGESVEKEMEMETDGIYKMEVSADVDIFESDVFIKTYDHYGKVSQQCPNIEHAEEGKGISNNDFVMIETIRPTVDIVLPKSDGKVRTDGEVWYNKNKKIEIEVKDINSGIRDIKISVNGNEFTQDSNGKAVLNVDMTSNAEINSYEESYVLSTDFITSIIGEAEDGKYQLKVETTDNAGNKFTKNAVYYIDKKNPKIIQFTFSPVSADNIGETSNFIDKLEYGFYFKKEFVVSVVVSDDSPSSGLDKIVYELIPYEKGKKGNAITKEAIINDGVASIRVPSEFKGQIRAKAYDMVQNVSKSKTPEAFVADNTAPEIKISKLDATNYSDANGNKLYDDNVVMKVTITDYKSGIRSIKYAVDAENNQVEQKSTMLDNTGYKVGDVLENGWVVVKVDKNLVTKVTQTFKFESDDNDVRAKFYATDRSNNKSGWVKSERFSIDKTAPRIKIDFPKGLPDNPTYYSADKKAVITVTVNERNFDEKLIETEIEDTFKGNSPKVKFTPSGNAENPYEYVAVINFPEGDYEFSLSGEDVVGHAAVIETEDGEKSSYSTSFIVDETSPELRTNFETFVHKNSAGENFFNSEKTAEITVTEHNFDPELMNLTVREKMSGESHSLENFDDSFYSVYSEEGWQTSESNPDVHTIRLTFAEDGIYVIDIAPKDYSENAGNTDKTQVFEIDCTAPVIVARNNQEVEPDSTKFVDVYNYSRQEEPNPTIEFEDTNFDHLEYKITTYVPEYSKGREFSKVMPEIQESEQKSKKYALESFEADGVYSVEITAYDKAGNASKLNQNTYMRMMDSDVLAYIEDSHPGNGNEAGTGWYSIEDENGPLSKRPDSFEDIKITVLAKTDSDTQIVLRDNNGEETDTGLESENEEKMYGVGLYRYTLKGEYFKDHYQEDTDATVYLTVNNAKKRIELGQIHIDNIAPSCDIPEHFHDWGWVRGSDPEPLEFTGISEKIDTSLSTVYIDGEKAAFDYLEDSDKLSIILPKGEHSVGVSLVDKAGNVYNIAEVSHLGVGNFRLWLAVSGGIGILLVIAILFLLRRRKKA